MPKQMIECSNCGRIIEKKQNRTMCIRCLNVANKIKAEQFRAEHREELREKHRERYQRLKKEGLA